MNRKNYNNYYDKCWSLKSAEYNKVKHYCNCGHTVIIPKWVDKVLCDWCGKYVYQNKKIEFKEKMKEAMKKCK